ncbi:MAG: epimerase [Myxococcales bacterium]|nr:epimerase [Myxococcales bacterium]
MKSASKPHALVTGFPRLLSRGLSRRWLNEHATGRVTLLCPPDDHDAAVAFREALAPPMRERLHVVIGQPLDTDLGLDRGEILRVLDETTHVFHTATEQTGSRAALRRRNVDGVGRLVELAYEMPRLERFAFFSTAFVSGNRTGVIREDDLDCGQRFRTAFERTMFDAEMVVRSAMPYLPMTVLRAGSLLGHSRTGEPESVDDGPTYLVRLLIRMPAELPIPLPGSGVVPLNIVPIDYVIRAGTALAQRPEAVSRTFHLCDPNPVSARKAFELLGDVANRPTTFTGRTASRILQGALRLTGVAAFAPQTLALFEALNTHVIYDCSGTLDLLSKSGISCPPFESYADQLVSWVARYERSSRSPGSAAPTSA